MKYLKLFNESFEHLHSVDVNDIGDYGVEMEDLGFNMTIYKRFYSDDKRVKEPTSTESIPYYGIEFRIKESEKSDDEKRFDGSYYLLESNVLSAFSQFIKRLKRWGEVYWFIGNTHFRCELWLPQIKSDIGFDWNQFQKKLVDFVDNIDGTEFISGLYGGGWVDSRYKVETDEPQKIIEEFLKKYDKWITYKLTPKKGRYKTLTIGINVKS